MGACQGALVVYTVGQKRIAKEHCNEVFWCDREDSNLWPSGSENYDMAVWTDAET